ncbi:hypothetical protein HR17_06365 [Porphyromonas gulae]|nr:hypothetical protein HR17_06365 [Porphyromonas gulae]KGN79630.1 hypothetical protein HR13_06455 [Porphyromonas gulae]KGO04471.1 hypothetical protein HR16_05075 [Porphyromonas gulae]
MTEGVSLAIHPLLFLYDRLFPFTIAIKDQATERRDYFQRVIEKIEAVFSRWDKCPSGAKPTWLL